MTIQAPAKVNLVLRILAKRPDGFHEIETLMVPVSLADEIELEVSGGDGIGLKCDHAGVGSGPENLVWRAVEAFRDHTGLRFHARIVLRKNIPHGAGLGGGSSDAATILKALDQIHGTRLGAQKLEEFAATLGSDVPFFIRSRPTMCRGRGELMSEACAVQPANLLLLKPPFPVPTAWAYQTWSPRGQDSGTGQSHGGIELANDFEEPIFQKFLLLPAIKSWLLKQDEVSAAMMSGSGSALFAILRRDAGSLAQRAKERFGSNLWTAETTLNPARSPAGNIFGD